MISVIDIISDHAIVDIKLGINTMEILQIPKGGVTGANDYIIGLN